MTFCSGSDIDMTPASGSSRLTTCKSVAGRSASQLSSGQSGYCIGQASYSLVMLYELWIGDPSSNTPNEPVCKIWEGSQPIERYRNLAGQVATGGPIDLSSCPSGYYASLHAITRAIRHLPVTLFFLTQQVLETAQRWFARQVRSLLRIQVSPHSLLGLRHRPVIPTTPRLMFGHPCPGTPLIKSLQRRHHQLICPVQQTRPCCMMILRQSLSTTQAWYPAGIVRQGPAIPMSIALGRCLQTLVRWNGALKLH